MAKTHAAMVELVKPLVEELLRQIADAALDQDMEDRNPFIGVTASQVYELIVCDIASLNFPGGSEEGAEWISKIYRAASAEARKRWVRDKLEVLEHQNGGGRVH